MKRMMMVIGLAVVASAILVPAVAAADSVPKKLDVMLYVDTVAGSRPAAGVKPRPVSCTQTNVYLRGEQQVFRVWGSVAGSGDILASDNVKYAYVSIPGQPNLKLSWGPHGTPSNRVYFWTAAWNLPADYPLGSTTAKIVFKTEDDSFGTYEYNFTVVPQLNVTSAKKATTKKAVTVKAKSAKS